MLFIISSQYIGVCMFNRVKQKGRFCVNQVGNKDNLLFFRKAIYIYIFLLNVVGVCCQADFFIIWMLRKCIIEIHILKMKTEFQFCKYAYFPHTRYAVEWNCSQMCSSSQINVKLLFFAVIMLLPVCSFQQEWNSW